MDFSSLENFHTKWRDILVIGKTIDRGDQKCHIVGMTLADEARLYIIEPCREEDPPPRGRGPRTYRRQLKERADTEDGGSCLHCGCFCLGSQRLNIQGGSSEPLRYADHGVIHLFFSMMSAGWTVPEWLRHEDWNRLALVDLRVSGLKRLPRYSPGMPITIEHRESYIRHLLEKAVTLQVGKSRAFCFVDHTGEQARCYINSVALIDVWKNMEEQFDDPRYRARLSPEELRRARDGALKALEQDCPRGMCYIGVEYECSRDLSLQFYSKRYLSSRPETRRGSSASSLLIMLKPDRQTGAHGLRLRGCAIQTPVPPDTTKIPAELFCCYEKIPAWVETVS